MSPHLLAVVTLDFFNWWFSFVCCTNVSSSYASVLPAGEVTSRPKEGRRRAVTASLKTVNERLKSMEQEKSTNDDTKAYIMSIMEKHVGKSGKVVQISDAITKPTPAAATPMLKSIVKRTKNAKAGT
jgi:hypothetical protein